MIFTVMSQMTLGGDTDSYEYSFTSHKEALDYYRKSFLVMAETIVDYDGDFTSTLFKGDVMIQRNTIGTTINFINNED